MDKKYWENYYKSKKGVHYPSTFGKFCIENHIPKESVILELGCGNGRDAFYFSEMGNKVLGVDQCQNVTEENISRAKEWGGDTGSLSFIASDFTKMPLNVEVNPNVVYSRFTFHSINKEAEDRVIAGIHSMLPKKGLFLIECRSTNDPLYNEGELAGENERITDHYRRFADATGLLKSLLNYGFKVLFFVESNNLAVHEKENPVVARYILEK